MAVPEQTRQQVLALVAEIAEVDAAEVTSEATFAELGMDSLDGLRLVAAVEKRFGVVIDEDAIPGVRSVADMLALVERLSGSA